MKLREPRYKLLVRARMKADTGWHDACILNISSRGMMLRAATPPARGSYLEIRRGAQVIVARVMWTNAHRFGVNSQNVLSIAAIAADTAPPTTGKIVACTERRAVNRSGMTAHDASRLKGRVMEFGFVAALVVVAATVVAGQVYRALAQPADLVTVALVGGRMR